MWEGACACVHLKCFACLHGLLLGGIHVLKWRRISDSSLRRCVTVYYGGNTGIPNNCSPFCRFTRSSRCHGYDAEATPVERTPSQSDDVTCSGLAFKPASLSHRSLDSSLKVLFSCGAHVVSVLCRTFRLRTPVPEVVVVY